MSVYNEIFGFVFLDPSLSVVNIRTNIVKDLQEIHSFKSMQNNFIFCDRNGWPINSEQEFHLTGWDIVADNMIKIRPFKLDTKAMSISEFEMSTGMKTTNQEKSGSTITIFEETSHVDGSMTNHLNNSNNSEEDQRQNKQEDYHQQTSSNSFQNRHTHYPQFNHSSPDVLATLNNINTLNDSFYKQHNLISAQTLSKSQSPRHKPILISYVRKEAEQHARNLKTQLTMLGCDVYLDVDEIKVGMDWQDALNEGLKIFCCC